MILMIGSLLRVLLATSLRNYAPDAPNAPLVHDIQKDTVDAIAGNQELSRVVQAVKSEPNPVYIQYDATLLTSRKNAVEKESYRVVLRTGDGVSFVQTLGDSGSVTLAEVRMKPPFGVAPNALFGLYRHKNDLQGSVFEQPDAAVANASSGRDTIAAVSSTALAYRVSNVKSDVIDGTQCTHLSVVPLSDSVSHNLREVWVDQTEHLPVRTILQSTVGIAGIRNHPLATLNYTTVQGISVISNAHLGFVLRFGFLAYGAAFDYSAVNVSFPDTEPAWMFDSALLTKHLKDVK